MSIGFVITVWAVCLFVGGFVGLVIGGLCAAAKRGGEPESCEAKL